MALDNNATKLTNLVDPEVMADLVNQKLTDMTVFTQYCGDLDETLVGQPGSTLKFDKFAYIGDAIDVAEGNDIAIAQLTASTTQAKVKKAGKGVQITDESVLSGHGDPLGQASMQLALSIASKLDKDILATMEATTVLTTSASAFSADAVADAVEKFGEDETIGQNVLIIPPEFKTTLRKSEAWVKATDVGANMIVSGIVGEIHGCLVVVSNKLKGKKEAFIVKVGGLNPAVKVVLKRDIMIESDRDIINKSTVVTADKHYVVYLYDATQLVKMTVTA